MIQYYDTSYKILCVNDVKGIAGLTPYSKIVHMNCWKELDKKTLGKMIPPGLEPGTLRVLGARDNRYTTESHT